IQTSSRWAPSLVWLRAISTHSSHREASIASLNALEPLAFVRSPMDRNDASWRKGTAEYKEATPGSGRGRRVLTGDPPTALTTSARWAGVVPQQPPTRESPNSLTNCVWAVASCAGESGYAAPALVSIGSPALGMQLIGMRECRDRWRRCSVISGGQVAQLRPHASVLSGCRCVR